MTTSAASFHPSLGEPGWSVSYYPGRVFPQDTEEEEEQRTRIGPITVSVPPASLPHIFAHRQWRAGMILADLIASTHALPHKRDLFHGRLVLELGCGTALPAFVAAHPDAGGAGFVLATDYDEETIVKTLRANVGQAVLAYQERSRQGQDRDYGGSRAGPSQTMPIKAAGYTWGTSPDDIFDLVPSSLPSTTLSSLKQRLFDTILLADTLWDPLSHTALAKSLSQTLARDPAARVIVVAGLHTGRERISDFVKRAARVGLEVAPSPAAFSSALPTNGAQAQEARTSLWDALECIQETDLDERISSSSAGIDAEYDWAKHVLEFELALEPDEQQAADETGASVGVTSTPSGDATTSTSTIIESRGPRLTGRRRRFVAQEALRPDEAKERGGIKLRNRWMTLWALRWGPEALLAPQR